METKSNNQLASVGFDVNITIASAAYLSLAIILPIIVFFVAKKYIR